MHVRIAWEIYYHQNKQNSEKTVSIVGSSLNNNGSSVNSGTSGATSSALSMNTATVGIPASNIAVSATSVVVASGPATSLSMKPSTALTLSSTSPHLLHRSSELTSAAYARSPFEASPLAASFLGAPPSHIGKL